MIVNCIHLNERVDRHEHFIDEVKNQEKCEAFLWSGVSAFEVKRNISMAHKFIIQSAKENLEMVAICEDDIEFTSKQSYKYFIDNIPDDFDLYFGGLSGGFIDEADNTVSNFSGLFLYIVHERFYDIFLDADESKNLDRALGTHKAMEEIEKKLGRKPIYKVCNPLVAKTINSYSDNHKTEMNLDVYWKPYKYLEEKSKG